MVSAILKGEEEPPFGTILNSVYVVAAQSSCTSLSIPPGAGAAPQRLEPGFELWRRRRRLTLSPHSGAATKKKRLGTEKRKRAREEEEEALFLLSFLHSLSFSIGLLWRGKE